MITIQLTKKELTIIFLALVNSSLDELHGENFRNACDALSVKFEERIHEESGGGYIVGEH